MPLLLQNVTHTVVFKLTSLPAIHATYITAECNSILVLKLISLHVYMLLTLLQNVTHIVILKLTSLQAIHVTYITAECNSILVLKLISLHVYMPLTLLQNVTHTVVLKLTSLQSIHATYITAECNNILVLKLISLHIYKVRPKSFKTTVIKHRQLLIWTWFIFILQNTFLLDQYICLHIPSTSSCPPGKQFLKCC